MQCIKDAIGAGYCRLFLSIQNHAIASLSVHGKGIWRIQIAQQVLAMADMAASRKPYKASMNVAHGIKEKEKKVYDAGGS